MDKLEQLVRDYIVGVATLRELYERRFHFIEPYYHGLFSEIEGTLVRFDFDGVSEFIAIKDEQTLRYELLQALITFHREQFTHRSGVAGTNGNMSMTYTLTHFRYPAYSGPEEAH